MEQLSFFGLLDKGIHGATWWAGNYQCRNFGGYFQDRENGIGTWKFIIGSFGDTHCNIYALDNFGEFCSVGVPIDHQSRISVNGRKYSNGHGRH